MIDLNFILNFVDYFLLARNKKVRLRKVSAVHYPFLQQ